MNSERLILVCTKCGNTQENNNFVWRLSDDEVKVICRSCGTTHDLTKVISSDQTLPINYMDLPSFKEFVEHTTSARTAPINTQILNSVDVETIQEVAKEVISSKKKTSTKTKKKK